MKLIKLTLLSILTLLLSSCGAANKKNGGLIYQVLGTYTDYNIVLINNDLNGSAKKYFSEEFYSKVKNEISNTINLNQRSAIQMTYISLGSLDSYRFKKKDNLYCLLLNGYDKKIKKSVCF